MRGRYLIRVDFSFRCEIREQSHSDTTVVGQSI
jgi:hypothetical protein